MAPPSGERKDAEARPCSVAHPLRSVFTSLLATPNTRLSQPAGEDVMPSEVAAVASKAAVALGRGVAAAFCSEKGGGDSSQSLSPVKSS